MDLIFGVDGQAVANKVIVNFFNDENCPQLKGKPRMFFLQVNITNDQLCGIFS